jgi:hypothetical protein
MSQIYDAAPDQTGSDPHSTGQADGLHDLSAFAAAVEALRAAVAEPGDSARFF